MQMKEIFCRNPQEEEKAVYRVGDDDMGMAAACTAQPRDTDLRIDCLSMREVGQGAPVRAEGDTVSPGTAPRAGLIFP